MENQSDEILWSLYLKGDKEALEQIYRRYYPLLLNYGCRLSANQDLVQDCIQNLFIKLMSKSRNLSDTPSVKGYLLKAFRNNLLDSLEKEEKQSTQRLHLPQVQTGWHDVHDFTNIRYQTGEIITIQLHGERGQAATRRNDLLERGSTTILKGVVNNGKYKRIIL